MPLQGPARCRQAIPLRARAARTFRRSSSNCCFVRQQSFPLGFFHPLGGEVGLGHQRWRSKNSTQLFQHHLLDVPRRHALERAAADRSFGILRAVIVGVAPWLLFACRSTPSRRHSGRSELPPRAVRGSSFWPSSAWPGCSPREPPGPSRPQSLGDDGLVLARIGLPLVDHLAPRRGGWPVGG